MRLLFALKYRIMACVVGAEALWGRHDVEAGTV